MRQQIGGIGMTRFPIAHPRQPNRCNHVAAEGSPELTDGVQGIYSRRRWTEGHVSTTISAQGTASAQDTARAPIIEVTDVSRRFVLFHERPQTFQELFVRTLQRNVSQREDFWALRDINLTVYPGDSVGIVGRNGSGKSTLLKLIAGLMQPTSGSVTVYGTIAALLEVGAGFHPDLSGRENIYLNGAFLGFSKKQLARIVPEIIAFSELEHFIDVPVKHYSSGMYMRLGFSIAILVDPDILITDEVFAVGDDAFRAKCEERIADFRRRGKTMLFVSHSLAAVLALCDRAIWLDQGKILAAGNVEHVGRAYRESVTGLNLDESAADLSAFVVAGT
jgi:ABC-type polysaccharide/polyol phosphate transport system ATPase subunit